MGAGAPAARARGAARPRKAALGLLWTILLAACAAGTSAPTPSSSPLIPTPTPGASTEPLPAPGVTVQPGPIPTTGASLEGTTVATTPVPTNTPVPAGRFASPEYGVQAFLWWKPDTALRDLRLIQEMGFGWVKQSFAWREIEGLEKGKYDWWRPDFIVDAVEDAGLRLLVRLDRQPFWSQPTGSEPQANMPPEDLRDFADFCGVLAARYRGRIAAYQIWNEPNLSREWGGEPPDPAGYTALLRGCYQAIKAADPAAIVVSAGLAPTGVGPPAAMPDTDYLQGMYDAGAGPYFDVLGVNAPGYKAPPELSPEEGEELYGHRSFTFRRVEDMRAVMVANGDEGKQVAILEMGWTLDPIRPEYAWFAVDEATQADYLVRAYQYAREHWQPWIGLMTTIYIAEYHWTPEDNEEYWWAIVLPDGTPRLAYEALKAMPK